MWSLTLCGPEPLASVPWQLAQFSKNSIWPRSASCGRASRTVASRATAESAKLRIPAPTVFIAAPLGSARRTSHDVKRISRSSLTQQLRRVRAIWREPGTSSRVSNVDFFRGSKTTKKASMLRGLVALQMKSPQCDDSLAILSHDHILAG